MPITQIYTLSLHDALPIYDIIKFDAKLITKNEELFLSDVDNKNDFMTFIIDYIKSLNIYNDQINNDDLKKNVSDRKSTRLNSSHQIISYAVLCLKTKNLLK